MSGPADRTRTGVTAYRHGDRRMTEATIVEIQDSIMRRNDELAAALRARFAAQGTFVVNLLSSPGSGKTTLLEETLRRLVASGRRVGALVGDQATENDALRL